MTPCAGPLCTRPAVAHGLCQSHRRQELAGKALRPLRPRTGAPTVALGVRVPQEVARWLATLGVPTTAARALLVAAWEWETKGVNLQAAAWSRPR